MKNMQRNRKGLILLVVLGMLSLFSLLAVSYMVVSSESRAANFGRARQDFRGTEPAKLLDSAIRQVVRGSSDTQSILWRNSLLGDLYGNAIRGGAPTANYETADGAKTLRARRRIGTTAAGVRRDYLERRATFTAANWLPAAQLAYGSAGFPEAPQILDSRFLRIPLDWNYNLPRQHDAWNGRVVTFLAGPLQGESFRILRYIGQVETLDDVPTTGTPPVPVERPGHQMERASQYSITIDLAKVSQPYVTIAGTRYDFAAWLASNTAGATLCYEGVFTDYNSYNILLNSGEQNSFGAGISAPTSPQTMADFAVIPALAHLPPASRVFPPPSATRIYRDLAVNLTINWAHIARENSNALQGDMDESYDAPDQNNPALSFIHPSGGTVPSDQIIPAFHRPALVNFIFQQIETANSIRGTAYELIDLLSTIELIQRACGRPLSWRIDNVPTGVSTSGRLFSNPSFDGSNPGEYSTATYVGSPQLVIDWAEWGNTAQTEQDKFEAWIRWLTRGPYDVDNDGDGFAESVWTDINLPLMTSREGKLLKAMAAFYIEDLGGRIDINRSGSLQQALADHSDFSADSAISFRPNNQLPQGLGHDTADISLRHIFGADGTANDLEYQNFVRRRNAPASVLNSNGTNFGPGSPGNDGRSLWSERALSSGTNPFSLPGFHTARVGRAGMSVDLFGNPILYEETLAANHANQIVDDPYEVGRLDTPYTIAEWERLERMGEPDRSHLPGRLEERVFTATTPRTERLPIDRRNVGRALSPRNMALQFPRSAQTYIDRYTYPAVGGGPPPPPRSEIRRVSTFLGLVEALSQQRWAPAPMEALPRFNNSRVAQLFPLEFKQNLPLDLNRPFGNGADDDGDGQIDEANELAGHGIDDTPDNMGMNGFGIDDDGDGIVDDRHEVDEPGELAQAFHQPATNINAAGTGTVNTGILDEATFTGEVAPENVVDESLLYSNPESHLFDRDLGLYDPALRDFITTEISGETAPTRRGAILQFNGDQSRQLLARHLYCLAQLLLPDDYEFANTDGGGPYAYGSDERARYIAQWAVNVVDFRDADHNMTRFCFDPDPFGQSGGSVGWEPDSDLVVFGHESPDLLLTETFAFHDLRISPNVEPVRPGSADRRFNEDDWRQIRVPEGSLFMEFFCPKGDVQNAQAIPAAGNGLRAYWSTSGELNLSMITPADRNGVQFPVWRVLLLEPSPAANTPRSVFDSFKNATTRTQLNYQFAEEAGLPWSTNTTANPRPVVDRVVWFTNESLVPTPQNLASPAGSSLTVNDVFKLPPRNPPPTNPMMADNRFVLVNRGQYLVTAPRETTLIGQELPLDPAENPASAAARTLPRAADSWPAEWLPSEQYISVIGENDSLGNQVEMGRFGGSFRAPNCTTAILKAHQPVAAWGNGYRPGLNVSEPKSNDYYEIPTVRIDNDPMGGFPLDGYVNRAADAFASSNVDPQDLAPGGSGPSNTPLDQYWEKEQDALNNDIRPKFMSRLNWSTAVLQRLANPDRPWHEELNPYITQDWLPIDLTVFSGEVSDSEPDPANPNQFLFKSIDGPDRAQFDNPNTPENEEMPVDDPSTTAVDESLGAFRFNSRQKTGFVVGGLSQTAPGTPMVAFGDVAGFGGRTFFSYHTENPFSNGTKANRNTCFEFPWAIQPNANASRISANRATAQWTTLGDLNTRFGLRGADLATTAVPAYPRAPVFADASGVTRAPSAPVVLNRDFVNSYELLSVLASAPGRMMQEFTAENPGTSAQAMHLFDFEMNRGANAILPPNEKSAAAIFELVDVRNPWLDTFELLNPNLTNYTRNLEEGDLTLSSMMQYVVMSPYRAPFNRIPTYEQPGRINLNTIANPAVYRALMWNAMTPRGTRNGTGTTLYEAELNDARRRLAAGSSLPSPNPLLNDTTPNQFPGALRSPFSALAVPTPGIALSNSIDATLLRTDEANSALRAVSAGAAVPFNAVLQNLPVSRLKNLTSNNSHTYSVRVTIGFFEFDPATGLGREYGIDEGTAKRHRGFYVIDRSIPVAFREGLDLNTERCILIRRIIE